MTEQVALLTVFVLAVFVGFEVVSKVSSTLHTPLMSGANAIHGIILVGAIMIGVSWLARVPPGFGTVCNMVFVGLWLDFFIAILEPFPPGQTDGNISFDGGQ